MKPDKSSLLQVFVPFLGLDSAENNSCLLRTEELTNRNELVK